MTEVDLRKPAPNQQRVDANSARMLRATWCDRHKRAMRQYADGVWACPICEAHKVLHEERSPHDE